MVRTWWWVKLLLTLAVDVICRASWTSGSITRKFFLLHQPYGYKKNERKSPLFCKYSVKRRLLQPLRSLGILPA